MSSSIDIEEWIKLNSNSLCPIFNKSSSKIALFVLNLPTLGPVILESILKRDGLGYAPVILLFLGFLTVVGSTVSDLLLLFLDKRIKYDN